MIIDLNEYVSYVVTGKTVRGKKFRQKHSTAAMAFGINLWNGRVWGITKFGRRKLLKRVIN